MPFVVYETLVFNCLQLIWNLYIKSNSISPFLFNFLNNVDESTDFSVEKLIAENWVEIKKSEFHSCSLTNARFIEFIRFI